jgi:hypothetical protein
LSDDSAFDVAKHSRMSNDVLNSQAVMAAQLDAARRIHELHMQLSGRIHELEMRMLRTPPPEKWYSSLSAAYVMYWATMGAMWVGMLVAAGHSGH